MFLKGPGHVGILQRMRNLRVLHDVELNWSVKPLKGFGTADLFRLVLSPTVKSVSAKCRLQTYCLNSVLACSAFQGMPSLSAHT
jgi:hypothetical protein